MDWTIFDRIIEKGCYYYKDPTSLPLEFSGAAFRVGHSQTRNLNRINEITEKTLTDLGLFKKVDEYVDWHYLFNFEDGKCQFAKRIDTKLGKSFNNLPIISKKVGQSLQLLNLTRGVSYGLSSGEDIAKRMGFKPVEIEETKNYDGTPL